MRGGGVGGGGGSVESDVQEYLGRKDQEETQKKDACVFAVPGPSSKAPRKRGWPGKNRIKGHALKRKVTCDEPVGPASRWLSYSASAESGPSTSYGLAGAEYTSVTPIRRGIAEHNPVPAKVSSQRDDDDSRTRTYVIALTLSSSSTVA
ncbi:uncharacterized protein SPSK_05649 [Sporothrix schenckii 1099-18]|uniref:Uncharacterized protein n=1 Tax=Sporothrix schenckii 1099-18 TaxID=1397361 RepID=A0A0F2LRR2_SPOSC|nr:uncharacterized protein SPSK_05649 [Sporothrix schenckii 1099-18]KJR80202.1 hypothetical protein SPSK_05649 [Sporothrix schenckii 1099-18]